MPSPWVKKEMNGQIWNWSEKLLFEPWKPALNFRKALNGTDDKPNILLSFLYLVKKVIRYEVIIHGGKSCDISEVSSSYDAL